MGAKRRHRNANQGQALEEGTLESRADRTLAAIHYRTAAFYFVWLSYLKKISLALPFYALYVTYKTAIKDPRIAAMLFPDENSNTTTQGNSSVEANQVTEWETEVVFLYHMVSLTAFIFISHWIHNIDPNVQKIESLLKPWSFRVATGLELVQIVVSAMIWTQPARANWHEKVLPIALIFLVIATASVTYMSKNMFRIQLERKKIGREFETSSTSAAARTSGEKEE